MPKITPGATAFSGAAAPAVAPTPPSIPGTRHPALVAQLAVLPSRKRVAQEGLTPAPRLLAPAVRHAVQRAAPEVSQINTGFSRDFPPLPSAPTASAALPDSFNLPGLDPIPLVPLSLPLAVTDRDPLDAVFTLTRLNGLVTAEADGRITHTFERMHADGTRTPVTLVRDSTGTLRRMTFYAESGAAAPNSRLDLLFGIPPRDAQWLASVRLALTSQQRSAGTAWVTHLEKNGVPLAHLELNKPWPQGPSDDCLCELLWSLGTRHGDRLHALAAQHGLTLARLSTAPRAALVALITGLADARQCLPLALSELRILPPRLSAPCIAQASAARPTQNERSAVLGQVLWHSEASECGATGVWGQVYTAGSHTIQGKYLPRDRFAAAALQRYRLTNPPPTEHSSAQVLLARLDERVAPVDGSLLRHWGGATLTLEAARPNALGLSASVRGSLHYSKGFLTWLAANVEAFTQAYNPGTLEGAKSASAVRVAIELTQPTDQPGNPELRAAVQTGLGRLNEAANAASVAGRSLSLNTWNRYAVAYARFLQQLERQPFRLKLPAGLTFAAFTHTQRLLAEHATAAHQRSGDPETLTRFRQFLGAVQEAIVAPLALRNSNLRPVLNRLHGLDLFGSTVPKTYAPRLRGHEQILQLCGQQGVAEWVLNELRPLLHYAEQR